MPGKVEETSDGWQDAPAGRLGSLVFVTHPLFTHLGFASSSSAVVASIVSSLSPMEEGGRLGRSDASEACFFNAGERPVGERSGERSLFAPLLADSPSSRLSARMERMKSEGSERTRRWLTRGGDIRDSTSMSSIEKMETSFTDKGCIVSARRGGKWQAARPPPWPNTLVNRSLGPHVRDEEGNSWVHEFRMGLPKFNTSLGEDPAGAPISRTEILTFTPTEERRITRMSKPCDYPSIPLSPHNTARRTNVEPCAACD